MIIMERNLDEYIVQNYQKAIDYQYIQVYYQPVIRTVSRKLCSFEALARWIDPVYGVIYPDEFIPVLEHIKAIHLLDLCILRQACSRIRHALISGETPIPVSVNLSRLDFTLCDIFTEFDQIVSEYQIPHDFIYCEITESIMAEKKELLIEIVTRFRAAGYQVWMDDFGSAYSSLNVLKEYSFDELKLDMCFLRPFNQRSQRIATAVIEMSKSIDIHTLAEGVETEEQFRYLRNIGCEKVQGYYFGKPMPHEECLRTLSEKNISIEQPNERVYYETLGKVDVLSSVPFMTREERNAIVTARQLNSIPLALIELERDCYRVLFYNSAFEQTVQNTELFANRFTQEILRHPFHIHNISEKLLNLIDSTRSGEEGHMFFTSNRNYYEIQAKCMADMPEKYTVMLRISNLSKSARTSNLGSLDGFLRCVYDLFERITLFDLAEDALTPLYIATRETLVSDRKNIQKMACEYAESFIFPADREAFLSYTDRTNVIRELNGTGKKSIARLFRTSVRHGQYAWKVYIILHVGELKYLLMIANVHDLVNASPFTAPSHPQNAWTPDLLWQNLIHSDLLRIFWKDRDRHFLGASKAFLDYYGFESADEIIGKNDEDLGWHVHPDQYMNDEFDVIHEGYTKHNIPGRCISNGENKDILASKTPLYDANGQIQGLMGYFIDRELLTANDLRGTETDRRDMITGLLNARGIAEEATVYRDEFYLRGTDFIRIHISIDNFNSINEQYGYVFGDKVMTALGRAFKRAFGLTCAVARYAGHKYVILQQVRESWSYQELQKEIRRIGRSVQEVDHTPITLYLSIGGVLFSECSDLDEQAREAEVRLLQAHDENKHHHAPLSPTSDVFRLLNDLPVIFAACTIRESSNMPLFLYVNEAFTKTFGKSSEEFLGRPVRDCFPNAAHALISSLREAAFSGEIFDGPVHLSPDMPAFSCSVRPIFHGTCSLTLTEAAQTVSS